MKHTKKLIAILSIFCLLAGLVACTGTGSETTTEPTTQLAQPTAPIRVATLKGPTGMGMAWLMRENENGKTTNKYEFSVAGAPDEITAKLVSGAIDIACLPTNAASILNKKTEGDISVLAVNTLGVLYVIEKGDSVKSIADLKGKKLVSAGKGTTAEFVVNYILEKNGLSPEKDVTIDYVSEHAQATSLALSGEYSLAIVPEPFVTSVTTKDSSFHPCLDLTEAWNESGAGELVMGAVVARRAFAEENPAAVKSFMADYKASVDFTNASIPEAAELIEAYGIAAKAVAQKAIPNCHIVFIDGAECKEKMSAFLQVLYSMNPANVGGVLPGDDFYFVG